ncbi:hypothetical protein HK100_002718 [Physocladia obscura]|uniref:NF-kappa-B-activating protein C-terminal domain-containing protein n=1 Tax=Physocladia obscura TaxID=109957 RepID=A0AAD5T841_9FUNG|nr:hypothetical protein HK100_002718 [Physocladia obscura]
MEIHPSRTAQVKEDRNYHSKDKDQHEHGYEHNRNQYRGRERSRDRERDRNRDLDGDRNRERKKDSNNALDTYSDHRRKSRDAAVISFWPRSPSPPRRESQSASRLSKSNSAKKKKAETSSDNDSDDSDDDNDSDSSEDARQRKSNKKSKQKSKHSKHSSSTKKKSSRKISKSKKRTRGNSQSDDSDDSNDASSKKKSRHVARRASSIDDSFGKSVHHEADKKEADEFWQEKTTVNDDDGAFGPLPAVEQDMKLDKRAYGGSLLAGEGSALAAYVQSGKRIPRRGEIGLQPEEIEAFEDVGYVMSGSRHSRMNAVRIRKENQVISAEEKNALLMFAQQEKLRKETETVALLKEMVAERTKPKE